jgi:hypothetical protein
MRPPSATRLSLFAALNFAALQWETKFTVTSALSTTPTQRPFIELTNPLRASEDRLPASFVANWPTWVLVLDTTSSSITTSSNNRWEKIPDSHGFVPPTSIDELWQPQDLALPQCQLAVGLHVRNGMIRHLMPAIDLTLVGLSNKERRQQLQLHRNRGIATVPRAYQWMDFGAAMAGGLQDLSLVLQVRDSDSDSDDDSDSDRDSDATTLWETLAEIQCIEHIVTAAIEALADNPPEELGDGSSVIHVLCNTPLLLSEPLSVACPRPGSQLRVLLLEDGATAGTLQVSVKKTAPGSESEYLPEAYKPLYQDESLLRPAFVETRKRMANRKQQGQEDGDEKE